MATKTQLEANRANAWRSSGPKTPAGKARSSMNAVKHGLTAKTIVIGDEDPAQFDRLRESLEERFKPRSVMERELTERLAGIAWRLRRIPAFEAAILETRCAQADDYVPSWGHDAPIIGHALIQDGQNNDALGKLARHEAALMNQFTRTVQLLNFLQSQDLSEDEQVIDAALVPSKDRDAA
jgi:hypothetical protein